MSYGIPPAGNGTCREILERALGQRCQRCKKINRQFIHQEREEIHHAEPWYNDFQELEESAVSGCDICQLILQEVARHFRHEKSYDDEAPISLAVVHKRQLTGRPSIWTDLSLI
jgi:hypothetical protein